MSTVSRAAHRDDTLHDRLRFFQYIMRCDGWIVYVSILLVELVIRGGHRIFQSPTQDANKHKGRSNDRQPRIAGEEEDSCQRHPQGHAQNKWPETGIWQVNMMLLLRDLFCGKRVTQLARCKAGILK